jgi:hypothetical protein
MSQAVCAAAARCSNTERSQQCFKKKCVATRQGIAFDMQMLQELKQEVGQGEEEAAATKHQGQGSEGQEAKEGNNLLNESTLQV